MTIAIQQPSTINFIQKILFEPFAEGAERVNRGVEGVNLHHILHPEIDLLERCWSLIVGIALMIPLINAIIWICMKTFGNPEKLSEPFTAAPPPPEEPPPINGIEIPVVADIPEPEPVRGAPLSVRKLTYNDIQEDKPFTANWTIETHEDMYFVKRTDGTNYSETTFDSNWVQKSHYIKIPIATVMVERRDNTLIVNGVHEGNPVFKELKIPNPAYPWIQQPTTAFRPFVLSSTRKFHFYGIHPTEFELKECVAKKEDVLLPPFGKVIKVSFYLNEGFTSYLGDFGSHLGTCWFDRENGDLLKMEYRLGVFKWGSSAIATESQSI